jgi:hypothetical protein
MPEKEYSCGCVACGPGLLPDYCPEHGAEIRRIEAALKLCGEHEKETRRAGRSRIEVRKGETLMDAIKRQESLAFSEDERRQLTEAISLVRELKEAIQVEARHWQKYITELKARVRELEEALRWAITETESMGHDWGIPKVAERLRSVLSKEKPTCP